MREIKFRVFNRDQLIGIERINPVTPDGWEWMAYTINPDHGELWVPGTMPATKGYARDQFTGFKDSAGIEIYDGDLLSLSETKYTYEIRWENGAWVCYHWNANFGRWGPLSRFFDPDFSKYYINRIGNIHQNPKAT